MPETTEITDDTVTDAPAEMPSTVPAPIDIEPATPDSPDPALEVRVIPVSLPTAAIGALRDRGFLGAGEDDDLPSPMD